MDRRDQLLRELPRILPAEVNKYAKYLNRPTAFAKDILGITFTPKQEEMAELLLVPPYRVLALSANSQGKTNGAAAIVLWWYATRMPARVITTAPKLEQVKDLLWAEIRKLARPMDPAMPFSPKACRIERGPEDYATGIVATTDTKFHGKHGPNQLFVFEEGTGVEGQLFTATESMFKPPGHAWLVICNPTTTESQVYIEYSAVQSAQRKSRGKPWHIVHMSAVDHPNVVAELKGEPEPIPDAMGVGQFETMLRKWSATTGANPRIAYGEEGGPSPGDVIWPPLDAVEYCKRTEQEPTVYRPGPDAQARLLARFPDQATTGIWGDGDWASACRELSGQLELDDPIDVLPELGCDVARFGDDMTEIHGRVGAVSLLHDVAAKRPIDQTAGRCVQLAKWLADWFNRRKKHLTSPVDWKQIPIKIDDDGVGGGVSDILIGMGANVVRISAQSDPNDTEFYPDKRSELWFVTAEKARSGDIDLSRIPADTRDELRRQALTATWKLNAAGQRVVESKMDIKKRLKRSPDGVDAMNLAYYTVGPRGIGPSVAAVRVIPTASGWMR